MMENFEETTGGIEDVESESCPKCGAPLTILDNIGRKEYIGCSTFPDCRYTRQIGFVEKKNHRNRDNRDNRESKTLGSDPDSGLEVSIRWNRYGAFAQLGVESNPKRTEIPMEWNLEDITLEMALKLLALPREVGMHPKSGHPIIAGHGRYGPFLLYNSIHTNLESIEEAFSISLANACAIIDKREEKRNRRWKPPDLIRTVGEHPNGGPITLHEGRRSYYVRYRQLNANVPEEIDPHNVTVQNAVEYLKDKPWKPYRRRHSRF